MLPRTIAFARRRTLPRAFALVTGIAATLAHADITAIVSLNPSTGGNYGDAVALVPDMDGDGVPDYIVGAPGELVVSLDDAGRVYRYSGKTGYGLGPVTSFISPNFQANGWFGEAIIGLPDIDGDGRGDFAVGAPNEGANNTGRLYVYSGKTVTLLYTLSSSLYRTFGALDVVPDCTGDGLPEIVVGYSGPGDYTTVRVYQAKNGALWRTLQSPLSSGAESSFGLAVAGLPDVTGDGRGDIAVGAPEAAPGSAPLGAGRVYIYNGSTGLLYDTIQSVDQQANGAFGSSVAGAPDMNGDGRGEIIIGAENEIPDGSTITAGQVHVHSGVDGAFIRTLQSTDPTNGGEFGQAVESCGDINGDGVPEIVVGAQDEVVSGTETGRVSIFSGASGSLLEGYTAPGSTLERFGHAIDASQDMNQDGRPDFIIGAPSGDAGGFAAAGAAVRIREVENDGCSALQGGVVVVSDGVWPFTTIGASTTGSATSGCGIFGDGQLHNDVFFTYVATCTDILTISTCNTANFDTRIAVYEGCSFTSPLLNCSFANLVACADGGSGCGGFTTRLELPVVEGTCYRIRIGCFNPLPEGAGWGTVLIRCGKGEPADLNGDFWVDAADLGILLGGWGVAGTPGDLDNDGIVGGGDLAILLGAWGPVP